MNKTIILVIIVVLLVGAGFFIFNKKPAIAPGDADMNAEIEITNLPDLSNEAACEKKPRLGIDSIPGGDFRAINELGSAGTAVFSGAVQTRDFPFFNETFSAIYLSVLPSEDSPSQAKFYSYFSDMVEYGNTINDKDDQNLLFKLGLLEESRISSTANISPLAEVAMLEALGTSGRVTLKIDHGWDGSPDEPMLQWIKDQLEAKGLEVVVPAMPEPEIPKIKAWIGKLNEITSPASDAWFVGHSVGCQAILRYLETLTGVEKFAGVILIAPWMVLDKKAVEEEGDEAVAIAKPWVETPIDFGKVRTHSNKFTAIFSDNDPYVSLSQKDFFEKELGAKVYIEHEKGHFAPDDGVKELPVVINEILK
jgi:predicted alpha/beta hydrolase family esterase